MTFDPLSLADRKKNGHLLLLGPTGAGKSATLISLLCQVMAIVRPRLYIVEAGNSFGLMAEYFKEQGLSVHRIALQGRCARELAALCGGARLLQAGPGAEGPLGAAPGEGADDAPAA